MTSVNNLVKQTATMAGTTVPPLAPVTGVVSSIA
jgi:hypothetical protein